MFAIGHAAASLVLKKKYPTTPMIWILLSVQIMELFWVIFNFIGLESIQTEETINYVGDIHLANMPFSHSVFTMTLAGILVYLGVKYLYHQEDIARCLGLGVVSHLVLDLLTHCADIAIAPFIQLKLGTGIYCNSPIIGFLMELGFSVLAWLYFEGNFKLLSTLVIFNIANIPFFFSSIHGPESLLVDKPVIIVFLILFQIIITLALVGIFSKDDTSYTQWFLGNDLSNMEGDQ